MQVWDLGRPRKVVSTKGRITFAIMGIHPLLYFFREYLISKGFALSTTGEADFVLVGGLAEWHPSQWDRSNLPILLLSDDSMYSDRGFDFKVRDKVPMREDDAIFIPSPLEPAVGGTLNYLLAENWFLERNKTMVLRVFGVYGPSIKTGLVHTCTQLIKDGNTPKVYSPGYQIRTYLHQDDLLSLFSNMLNAFLDGTTGIYNVGSSEEVSIKRLVDSVWNAHGHKNKELETCWVPMSYRWWVIPDLTRTKAVAKLWREHTTLRTGLWKCL